MTTLFYIDIEGCDGSRGSSTTHAETLAAARAEAEDRWPDARRLDVYSHATYLEREAERHARLSRQPDDYDDSGWYGDGE